ncbi:MAG: lysine biosynthesis protein LysW [archaeon]
MAECPVCSSGIELGENTLKGELVTCTQCGTELEVASINPIALKEAPKEEEDWGE